MTGVVIRREDEDTEAHEGRGHMKTEAERKVTLL